MNVVRGIWNKISENADLYNETLPGQTIVEIVGENRVIVENHMGVKEYSTEIIGIRVGFGQIEVHGNGLELVCITSENLVINGKIDGVSFLRG